MRRRHFIALVATSAMTGYGSAGLNTDVRSDVKREATQEPTPTTESGCASPPTETAATSSESGTVTRTETASASPPSTRTRESDVEISSSELVTREGEYVTEKFVDATVRNNGSGATGQVELTVDWYDNAGDYLGNATDYLYSLGADETWQARVHALSDVESVSDFEIGGLVVRPPPRNPDGLSVTQSSLTERGGDVVVSGDAENATGGALSYVEAGVKLYNGSCVVLDSNWTNVSDVPEGETWAFEVEFLAFDRIDRVSDHEVVLNTSL